MFCRKDLTISIFFLVTHSLIHWINLFWPITQQYSCTVHTENYIKYKMVFIVFTPPWHVQFCLRRFLLWKDCCLFYLRIVGVRYFRLSISFRFCPFFCLFDYLPDCLIFLIVCLLISSSDFLLRTVYPCLTVNKSVQ